jgi:hypothetical protein
MTNDISKLANMMIEVEGGERCPLQFHIELKALADAIKEFQDQVKPLALTEASKWHGQVYCGYEITKKAGGGRYNYDHIPEIIELKNQVKELEKQAQYAYKTTTQGLLISADGELITPAQYIQNDDTIQIKLAK